jgi:hypothetical protein
MSEQSAETAKTRRKKTSRILFAYSGKEFVEQSKENESGLHKAACAWLNVLRTAGRPMDRDECLTALAEVSDTGTSQKPIRIIYYWKKTLIDGGYITLSRKDGRPIVTTVPDASNTAAPAVTAEAAQT